MIYEIRQPSPPLSRFVERLWFFDDYYPAHCRERVLPEGAFELVINLRDESRKLFDASDSERYRQYRSAWLSGAQAQFIVIDAVPRSSMIGVHFRPGGAAPFLQMPADEFTGRVEELNLVWGKTGDELRQALLETPNVAGKFRLLEQFLLGRLREIPGPNGAVNHAIEALMQSPDTVRLKEMATELGMSHKHFIAAFRARVGLSPKRFCRIRRFQQALSEIERRRKLEWAELACDAGYFDQSHFIRDFRAFSGLNPSAYLTERGEYLNYVPVPEQPR